MSKTSIEWTTRTWNPMISGCSMVSEGCTNCYAMKVAHRLGGISQTAPKYAGLTKKTPSGKIVWTGEIRIDEQDEALYQPLHIKKPTTFFVNSMTDVFHEDVPFHVVDKIMAVIALCPQHTFQILTKRADRMCEYFSQKREIKVYERYYESCRNFYHKICREGKIKGFQSIGIVKKKQSDYIIVGDVPKHNKDIIDMEHLYIGGYPFPNLWIGVSVENKNNKPRIDILREIPAKVRFLSLEPLLEDLGNINLQGIDWVIVGGESGKNIRPMHPDWVRSIRNQCLDANVPFFFKQWGEWLPLSDACEASQYPNAKMIESENGIRLVKVGKHAAGRLLEGREYNEMPKI